MIDDLQYQENPVVELVSSLFYNPYCTLLDTWLSIAYSIHHVPV